MGFARDLGGYAVIQWTKEAIIAAVDAYHDATKEKMKAALDAAVAAQLGDKIGLLEGFTHDAYDGAIIECAETVEELTMQSGMCDGVTAAKRIRSLAKTEESNETE